MVKFLRINKSVRFYVSFCGIFFGSWAVVIALSVDSMIAGGIGVLEVSEVGLPTSFDLSLRGLATLITELVCLGYTSESKAKSRRFIYFD